MSAKTGWLLAIASIFMYSITSPVTRGAILAGMAPTTLLAGRFIVAALLFGATTPLVQPLFKGRGRGMAARPMDRRGYLLAIGSGLVNGISLYFLYNGLFYLGAALSSMLMIGLYPIFTLILLALRGERPDRVSALRLGLGIAGLYLLLGPGGVSGWQGVILTGLAAVFFAVHLVSVQWYLRPYSTWPVTAVLVSSAAVMVVIIWFQEGMNLAVPGWIGWAAILVQALVATYLGRLITYAAINLIGSAQFALLSPVETLLTVFWSALFLRESLTGWQITGGILILAGAALVAGQMGIGRSLRRSGTPTA